MRKGSLLITFTLVASAVSLIGVGASTAEASQSFVIDCKHSHRRADDPIVHPGEPGMGHLHEFFGNRTTSATSTYASMVGKPTTCDIPGDTAAYWAPTLKNAAGTPIPPRRITVYYRDRPQGSVKTTAFPPDFRMIAGWPGTGYSGWNCDGTSLQESARIDCSGFPTPYVRGSIIFPMCGQRNTSGKIVTDSPNHRSHVAYGTKRRGCPASHPVQLPAVKVNIRFGVTDCRAAGCYLVSDMDSPCSVPGCSLHADYWNTWD
ncbi:MAG: DUF1996 domain-containing protein, partial [Actinomycetota bacterium]